MGMLESIRMLMSGALFATCMCHLFGIRDTDQAFWPLIAIGVILTWAVLSEKPTDIAE